MISHRARAKVCFGGDLYARPFLENPLEAYRTLRGLAPAVWMPRRRLWAIARHEDVRMALRSDEVLVSGAGIAANGLINAATQPITLTSDGETHIRRRQNLVRPLGARPLKALREGLEDEADRRVESLTNVEAFDAIPTFAAHLPLTVVAELVGLESYARVRLLRWASATFDALGVMNGRGLKALPQLMALDRYVRSLDRSSVTAGGWADQLFDAVDEGALRPHEARAMIIDYVAPALDTTILAAGHMVWQLGESAETLERLRAEPALIPAVVNEIVRMASPIRGFTRLARDDYPIGQSVIARGQRVLLLFASANRDERAYPDPDRFDPARNPRDHLGWGHGPHTCAGMHLARMELEILLEALVRHVERVETGAPTRLLNNVLQGYSALPTRFIRSRGFGKG